MFFHVCKILWRRILKSSRDDWLLKKVPGRYERCILQCVTPWTFWQKSLPLDIGQNFDQKQKKKLLFWVFGWTFLFKLLLFLNELSYRYQIGLKLKLIHSIFKKYSEENFFFIRIPHLTWKKSVETKIILVCYLFEIDFTLTIIPKHSPKTDHFWHFWIFSVYLGNQ